MKTTIDVSELQQAWLSSASLQSLFEGGDPMEADTLAMEDDEEQATGQPDYDEEDAEAANMNVQDQDEDDGGEIDIDDFDDTADINQTF